MFGYIRTDTPELLVRENEYYRAIYCGLCRAQGKCTGQCSRMTLSYDVAFLAMLRLAIDGAPITVKRGRCIAHPFRKRAYVACCEPLEYCAYAAAILAYGKSVDDVKDEHGIKRAKAVLSKLMTSRMRKRSMKKYSELDTRVADGLAKLSDIEKQSTTSVDMPADAFGDVLADIMSFGLVGSDEKIMKSIGKHIGRWIYIIDAADDADEDIKNGRYNAFVCFYGGNIPNDDRQGIADALKLELLAAEPAFDLIDYYGVSDIEGIVKNIIYRGMPRAARRVLRLDNVNNGSDKKPKGKKNNV